MSDLPSTADVPVGIANGREGPLVVKEGTYAAGAGVSFVWTFTRPASELQPHAIRIAAVVGVETTHAWYSVVDPTKIPRVRP
jgi:hypothetical protein